MKNTERKQIQRIWRNHADSTQVIEFADGGNAGPVSSPTDARCKAENLQVSTGGTLPAGWHLSSGEELVLGACR